MKPNKLITDTRPIDQPQESYLRAYNIILNKAKGAVVNEHGFEAIEVLSKKVIYALPVDNDELILWLLNTDAIGPEGSEIARLSKGGTYTTVVKDDTLNFSIRNNIKSVFIRNFKGQLVIMFEDGNNPSRIINIDDIYPVLDVNNAFVDPDDINLLNIEPYNSNGYIEINSVRPNGGELVTGAYYFSTCYDIPDGSGTSWGAVKGPVFISNNHPNDVFADIDGAEPGTPSSKSIELSISNIDTRYKYMRIAVIKKIGGVLQAEEFAKFKISGTERTIIYTGGEVVDELIAEEILTPSHLYHSAKTLTLLGNTLSRANLKVNPYKEYNYQSLANDIKIDWILDEVDLEDYDFSFKDPMGILARRGYFPDEVYAFYIRLHFKDGSKSDAFHIPGPDADSRSTEVFGVQPASVLDRVEDIMNNAEVTSYNTPFLDEDTVSDKSHFVDDLNVDKDIRFFHTRETALNREDDNMGVWYNETELYPDNPEVWGSLAGTPVRHHKFPCLEVIDNRNTEYTDFDIGGVLELLSTFTQRVSYIKSEGYAGELSNADGGKAFHIPVQLIEQQGWNVLQNPQSGGGDGWFHDTNEDVQIAHPEQGWYIYKNPETSSDFNKFFIDNLDQDRNIEIDYEVRWKYNADGTALALGNAAKIKLQFLNPVFNPQDGDGGYTSVSHTYSASGVSTVEEITGLSAQNDTEIITQGTIPLSLLDKSNLGFVATYIHEDNNVVGTNSNVDIDFTIYEAKLTVRYVDGVSEQPSKKGKVLGIKARDIVIPQDIASDVIGYELLYAKRDDKNMRVWGQSLAFGSGPDPLTGDEIGTHAGNNPIHAFKNSIKSYVDQIDDGHIRLHSFDMLKNKPAVKGSFLKVQKYISANITNYDAVDAVSTPYNPDPESTEGQKRLTDETPIQAHYRVDVSENRIVETTSKVLEGRRLRAITDTRYLAPEAIIKDSLVTINNSYGEECVLVDVLHPNPQPNTLEPGEIDTVNGWLPANAEMPITGSPDPSVLKTQYFLVNFVKHRQDVYRSFFDQELSSTGKIFFTENASGVFNTSDLYGGDTFFNYYGIRLTAPLFYDPSDAPAPDFFSTNAFEALKAIYYFPCYSISNIGLRHAGDHSKDLYYPKAGTTLEEYEEWMRRAADFENTNSMLYNTDYSSISDLEVVQPYKTEEPFFEKLPYRIITSKGYQPEDKEFSLRTFLANDYYEMPKNKGEITNLEGYGTSLYVHTKYALYKSATQERLTTSGSEVALGTGELFSLPPNEIQPSNGGFAGLQDMFGYMMSDIGYIFIDAEQSKIFLVGSQIDEITRYGSREFFRKHLKLKSEEQMVGMSLNYANFNTPYEKPGTGYSIAFDSEFERFLISKRDWTLKYPNDLLINEAEIDDATSGLLIKEGKFYKKVENNIVELSQADIDYYFEDKSFTMSYNPFEKTWICRHDYLPEVMVSTRNEVYSFKNSTAYKHNDRTSFAKYYDGSIFPSFADVVFNPANTITKMFPSIRWTSEVVDGNDVSKYLETITHIAVFTATHCTGLIPLVNMQNIRNVEGHWNFNKIRDIIADRNAPFMDQEGNFIEDNLDDTMPYYNKRRIAEKYAIVRFLYDNLAQKTLYLYDVSATYIESRR